MTNVTTIYDIFCPVPFLPSPFGFRQTTHTQILFFWSNSAITHTHKKNIHKTKLLGNYLCNVFVMPGTFSGQSHRPLTPIFLKNIAIHLPCLSRYFCKSMPSRRQKVVYTPPICIRARGRWDTPQGCLGFRTSRAPNNSNYTEIFPQRLMLYTPMLYTQEITQHK